MPTEAWRKSIVASADVAFGASWTNIDSLGIGDLAWSAQIITLGKSDVARFHYDIKGGTAPTAGKSIEFYVGYADDNAAEIRVASEFVSTTSSTNTVTAEIDRILEQCQLVHVQSVVAILNQNYRGWFDVAEIGADATLFVYNNTDQTLNGTTSPHKIHVTGYGPEGQ